MSIQDFLKKADKLLTLQTHDDKFYNDSDGNKLNLVKNISLDCDFNLLFEELMIIINDLSQKHLKEIIQNNPKIGEKLINPLIDENQDIINRRIISKLNYGSNQIAINSRIGAGNVLMVNGRIEYNVIDMFSYCIPFLNNNLPIDEAIVLRKSDNLIFDYYVENDETVFYNFTLIGDDLYKQYVKIYFKIEHLC
jgi:hypothetical protein